MYVKQVIEADPYPLAFAPVSTALLLIDMQRDFLEPGGFVSAYWSNVNWCRSLFDAWLNCQK